MYKITPFKFSVLFIILTYYPRYICLVFDIMYLQCYVYV